MDTIQTIDNTNELRKTIMIVGDESDIVKRCLEELVTEAYPLFSKKQTIQIGIPFELVNQEDQSKNYETEYLFHDSDNVKRIWRDVGMQAEDETALRDCLNEKFSLDLTTEDAEKPKIIMKRLGKRITQSSDSVRVSINYGNLIASDPCNPNIFSPSTLWTIIDRITVTGDFGLKNRNVVVVPTLTHPSGSKKSMSYYESMIQKYNPDRILFCSGPYETLRPRQSPLLIQINKKYKDRIDYVFVDERSFLLSERNITRPEVVTTIPPSVKKTNSSSFVGGSGLAGNMVISGANIVIGGSNLNKRPPLTISRTIQEDDSLLSSGGYTVYKKISKSNHIEDDTQLRLWIAKENLGHASTKIFTVSKESSIELRDYILNCI